jgi:hypothetical protein
MTTKTVFLCACLVACVSSVQAQDRVLGLLALPEVFGQGACDGFTPEELQLFAQPDAGPVVGRIRVDEYWTFHDVGGCAGLKVNVHNAAGQPIHPLPAEEYGYEQPGAVVLEQRGRWFRIRLADGAAWVRASARAEYYPLQRLLADSLAYLTKSWDRQLAESVGGVGRSSQGLVEAEPSVRVIGFRQQSGQLWVQVEVLSHSGCESADGPRVTARGWLPAHSKSGERSIWFHARGC